MLRDKWFVMFLTKLSSIFKSMNNRWYFFKNFFSSVLISPFFDHPHHHQLFTDNLANRFTWTIAHLLKIFNFWLHFDLLSLHFRKDLRCLPDSRNNLSTFITFEGSQIWWNPWLWTFTRRHFMLKIKRNVHFETIFRQSFFLCYQSFINW